MFKKGHKLYSIFRGKCPRCHEGDFFAHSFPLNPVKITQIHKNCHHCDLKYMMEPSFFYGAMYVNYALAVAVIVASFIIAKVLLSASIGTSFISVAIASLVMAPINLRLSRILWINLFVKYDKEFVKKSA